MGQKTSKPGVWILQSTEECDGRLLGVFSSEDKGQKFVEEIAGVFWQQGLLAPSQLDL